MLEKMDAFFSSRVDIYDDHMLNRVEGCREGYLALALEIPPHTKTLLDLGCGTGLELEAVFERYPDIAVTGIDLAQPMLDRLAAKYTGRNITLINANYLDYDFAAQRFDAAISFQTLHHLSHGEKKTLYRRIYQSLTQTGKYIECDYMVESQAEEDFFFAENARIRQQQAIPAHACYHYDTPCTVDNQIALLRKAGFRCVKQVWKKGNTTMIVGQK